MTPTHRFFRIARTVRRALLLALVLSPIAASTHEYYGLDFTLIHPWADATPEEAAGLRTDLFHDGERARQ
jgi:hypothetical protein